jgi:hypothetical protein
MSDTRPDEDRDRAKDDADRSAAPAAGPHATPELTNADATPGAGSLPDTETDSDSADGTG